jgi:hypothetical protein
MSSTKDMVSKGGQSYLLPKDSQAVGVWVKNAGGDVHAYIMHNSVVIGTNISYKDKVEFSDMALIASQEEGLRLQYAQDGKPVNVAVSEETWKQAILAMLVDLKDKAIAASSSKEVTI